MNAPIKKPPRRAKMRLVKKADHSKAGLRRLARAMDRVSREIEASGKRDELLRELPPILRE